MASKEEASTEAMKTESVKAGRGGAVTVAILNGGCLPLSAVKAPRHRPSNPAP